MKNNSYKILKESGLVILAAAFLVSGFFVPGAQADLASLTVISPNGGELLGGGTFNITWTSSGGVSGDLVDIALIDEVTGSSVEVATNLSFDASPYPWTALPGVANGANYKIRILKAGTSIVYDTSNAVFTIDNTAPTITSVTTYDDNGNGSIDRAKVVFSESIKDSSFSASSFSIGATAGSSINSGTTVDDNTFDVIFPEITGTGVKTLVYTLGAGRDLANPGNLLLGISVPATDAAAPVFLSAKTKTITTIEATFSEDIDGSTLNTGGTEFAVAGHTVSGASETGPGVITLTLLTTMGTGETPAVTFTNIDNFKDLAGNQALSPITKTATDGVAPVLTEITPVTTPTLNDTPDYTFNSSEAGTISYAGGCTSTTVASAGNNTITFNTLTDGTYSACILQVTDLSGSGNESTPLAISSFQVDTTPVGLTDITAQPGGLIIGATPFSPALSDPLLRMQDAHYAVRAISIVAQTIPNVQWRITIEGPAGFIPDMVDLDEVGWQDPNETSLQVFHYPFAGSGTLVATGSCTEPDPVHSNSCLTDSFEVDPTDDFKNVDKVKFSATAPLGIYTIKRQLIENGTTPRSNELTVATFTVTNNPPVLDSIGDQPVDEETPLTFTATATDTEGSALTFSLVGAPVGASINGSTGVLTWTPTEAQGPNTYTFTVQVADSDGGIDSEEIDVDVDEVNIAPVANTDSVTTNEDNSVVITLPATDADIPANTLIYSIADSPIHGTLGIITGNQVTYTPSLNYFGPDSFTFKVNDRTVDSNVATINITVNAVNDAPELTTIPPQNIVAGNILTFDADSTDVDGGAPDFSVNGDPGLNTPPTINPSTGIFSWTPTISGVYSFTVTVSDGNGGTDSQPVQVTVNHAAIAKVVVSAAPANLSVANQSTITVTGKDQFNNVTTSDNSTVVVLSADNGGSLGTTLLTLTNGVAETTLSKSSAGDVHVNASSGVLIPSQVTVTFNAVPGDIIPPTVISHMPADDATNIPIEIVPLLLFSEPLKSTTVNSANIQLKKFSDNTAVPAIVSLVEGGTKVQIDPTNPLEHNTQYYFAVSTGVKDEVGNPLATALDVSTKTAHEFKAVAILPIVVDEIIAQNSTAAATDSYLDGWHYTFRITVNTGETNLLVKFADWENSANHALKVAANGNMRLLFNTSTGNGLGSIVGLTDADIVSGVAPISSFAIGNLYTDQLPGAVNLGVLDISTDPGRQIKFDVFTKLPATTAPGFYETVFVIQTQ